MTEVSSINTLLKHSTEDLIWSAELENHLQTGETISSIDAVTVDPSSTFTAVSNTTPIDGTKARIDVAAGTAGEEYKVTIEFTTNLTPTRIAVGRVKVRDC